MLFRGLKINVAITLVLLLLLAMVLMHLVSLFINQKLLTHNKIQYSENIATLIIDQQRVSSEPNEFHRSIQTLIAKSDFLGALIVSDSLKSPVTIAEIPPELYVAVTRAANETIVSGKAKVEFIGSTWAVFWPQSRYMIIIRPLANDLDSSAGAIAIIYPMAMIYKEIRQSQAIMAIYSFINLIVLALIGLHQLSGLYLKPVQRLASRAEEFSLDDKLFFSVRKDDNELGVLSKSLNRMLKRISDDKQKLKETVGSLQKANKELENAHQEIIRAEKFASVGRLASGLAHEIGNPIGIVLGYLELLKQDDIKTEEKNDYANRSIEEIQRINTIIRQLLDFARKSDEGTKHISVHDLIEDLSLMIQVQPFMANIELICELDASDDIVLGEADPLRQVFLNLILNAADAIRETNPQNNGQLRIESLSYPFAPNAIPDQHGVLEIRFIDNGIGIASDDLDNIFDPFFTTKDPGKGTGLGLSVSYAIIERFGGQMSAISRPAEGTRITVKLPLAGDPEPDRDVIPASTKT